MANLRRGGGNPASYWRLPFDERSYHKAPGDIRVRRVVERGLHWGAVPYVVGEAKRVAEDIGQMKLEIGNA